MSNSDALADAIVDAGTAADDRGWQMPMAEEYARGLKSNFADFANVGGREGGAITAACFLGKFTDGLNWAHIDIAGVAWRSGAKKGATGRPVPSDRIVESRLGPVGSLDLLRQDPRRASRRKSADGPDDRRSPDQCPQPRILRRR